MQRLPLLVLLLAVGVDALSTRSTAASATATPSKRPSISSNYTRSASQSTSMRSTRTATVSSTSTLCTTQSQAPSRASPSAIASSLAQPLQTASASQTASALPAPLPMHTVNYTLAVAAGLRSLPAAGIAALTCDLAAALLAAPNVSSASAGLVQLVSEGLRNGTLVHPPALTAISCAPLCSIGASGGSQLCNGTQPSWPSAGAPAGQPAGSDILTLNFTFSLPNATAAGARALAGARLAAMLALNATGFPAFAAFLNTSALLVNTSMPSPGLSFAAAAAAATPRPPPPPPPPAPSAPAAAADSVALGVGLFFLLAFLLCISCCLLYNYHLMRKAQRAELKPGLGSIVNYQEKAEKQFIARGGRAPRTLLEQLQRAYPLPGWLRPAHAPMPLAGQQAPLPATPAAGSGGGSGGSGSSGSSGAGAGGRLFPASLFPPPTSPLSRAPPQGGQAIITPNPVLLPPSQAV